MSIGRYLKDHYLYILTAAAILVLVCVFLSAFSIPPHAILFVAILMIAIFVFIFVREYSRRKRYYDNLAALFEKLDQKFLIGELMEEGDFADAVILYDLMRRTGKAMNDEIAAHKLLIQDYTEFLESWVHEIKTPIAAARLAAANNPNQTTDSIQKDLADIERYVQNVLFYARSSIVEKDYMIRPATLENLVKRALRENSRMMIESGMSVEMENLDITAYTDEKWTLFILGQIISNSVKYRRAAAPKLLFRGEKNEQNAVLHIIDNGIGIPAADIPRVFEKGFTGENGRKYSKSTGMGLYLCRKLCQKLGAGISVQSESGTQATLVFPGTDMYFR